MPVEIIRSTHGNHTPMTDSHQPSRDTPIARRNERVAASLVGVLLFAFFLSVGALPSAGQMAETSDGKFVGNILHSTTTVDPVFDTFWNQVTPENSGKWSSVEATRDVMNWTQLDFAYNYTRTRGIPFKLHTLVWGQQYPAWMDSLPANEQLAEVEEWIAALAARYPGTEYIDVVNEPLPGHAPAPFRNALGGAGATGWDWVSWTFQKAREYFPNAKLHINDYNVINSDSTTTQYLTIINLLKDRGLIDGIGEQAHFYESTSLTTLQNNLNRLAATGLPIFITELDINIANDTNQSNRYQQLFPLLWTHPSVRGITFWGYKQGQIWRTDGYLLRSDGSERPALTWMKNYIAANPQSFGASITAPANGQGLSNVAPVTATATVTYGTAPFTVTFQRKLDSETSFTTVSSDTTAPYTADLGNLPVGTYQVRVIVTDADARTATSQANTFNVFPTAGGTWLGVSGNWDDSTIWSGGTIANGIGSTASFTGVDIAADQTITLNGDRTIGNIVFTDATTPSHHLAISGSNTLTLDADSGAPVINVTQADRRLTISSVIAGTEGLQKAGSGTLTLSGGNTYTGTTTVSAGTLRLEGNAFSTTAGNYSISSGAVLERAGGGIPTGTTTISGTGTFRISGGGLSAGSDGRDLNLSLGVGGLIDIQTSMYNGGWGAIYWSGNQATLHVSGSLNIVDGQAITAAALTGAGTMDSTATAGTGGGAAANFTLGAGNGSGTFSGNITAAGTRVISLVKNGTGTQTFSGTTTFRGTTTVNAGTLHFARASSLYAGATTDWVKTKITVHNGGTIAFHVGGTNEFTAGNVTTLLTGLGGAVTNNGLRAGSTIAFDTTNASGGSFTIADVIANTTGTGGGAVGLRKIGTNTLVLSHTNTYTGPTNVDQGTLAVTGSLGATAVSVHGGTLAGNGDFGGNVTIGAGAMHSLSVAATPASQDTSIITGTLAMGESTLSLTAASSPAPGVYVLATAATGITGFPSFINRNGIKGTVSVDATSTPKRLLLTITPYEAWAATHSPSGDPDGDYDNDGVPSAIEFVLGGDKDTNDANKLPTIATPGTNMTFSFLRDRASVDPAVSLTIEVGTNLATWPDVFTVGTDTAHSTEGVTVSNNGDGTDTITLTTPQASDTRKFARLKVTITP
jgi:autotransporter-associated beta strand protein